MKKYLYYATDTQRLADQAKFISYGPARYSSAPLVGNHADLGIDMKPHMPTDPNNAATIFDFDYVWWADHRAELDEVFTHLARQVAEHRRGGMHMCVPPSFLPRP